MEYSSDDIAAAKSLQSVGYMFVSMATFWIYDYACSLHEEWSFLLQSNWSKAKALYIVTRYIPFLLLTEVLYMGLSPNENTDKCRLLSNISSGLVLISAISSECFFILRTCALWNNNRILVVAMLITVPTIIGVSVAVTFATTAGSATYATSAIPGITGCYWSSGSIQLFVPYLLLSALEMGLMILTIVRAIQSWKINPSHLYVVLVKHNIFYYICGFLFSIANVFVSLLLDYSYNDILQVVQFIILAILATRMHLHLWHANRDAHSLDALVHIPMSDMAPA
ncbi:hypothetical protein BDR04DRAFT_711739 [Suillus decipiens]|nr:hypothetical protein BDR04DRAFT_711739 [Suillus decipiens]